MRILAATLLTLTACAHPGQLATDNHRSTVDLQGYNANLAAGPAPKVAITTAWYGDSYVALGAWGTWFPGSENDGVGGNTIAQVTARAQSAQSIPPTVYVWCGLNDMMADHSYPQIQADYTALVTLLQSRGAQVICLSPLPPGSQFPADLDCTALTPASVAQLCQIEQGVAQQLGAQWIDLRPAVVDADGWCDRAYVMPCGLHLDAAGYTLVVPVIRGWSNG